ncbi:MAG: radical SAM family heme chaperone HemW [Elusimicrobiota bacterium]
MTVYIHIPFCRKKCSYCDFVSYSGFNEKTVDLYLKCLAREMENTDCQRQECQSRECQSRAAAGLSADNTLCADNTLYIGGGTPSLLSCSQMDYLFGRIKMTFGDDVFAEVSVEVNPESVADDKLTLMRNAGVNRLSFGLQSFSERELKGLGRVHTASQFERAYVSARQRGFKNINIDLMNGIPGQNMESWKETLNRVVHLLPEHISIYPLTVEPGTVFQQLGIKTDDDLQADMYESAGRFLLSQGYQQYEISNFSLPGFRCRHNLRYWKNESYYGFGVSAVSYNGGVRKKNTTDINKYIKAIENGSDPAVETERLTGKKKMAERIMLGLRLTGEGINLSSEEAVLFEDKLIGLKRTGLLEKNETNGWRLTRRGQYLSNFVFREIL